MVRLSCYITVREKKILEFIKTKPKFWRQIVKELDMPPNTPITTMNKLKNNKIIKTYKIGRLRYFEITKNGKELLNIINKIFKEKQFEQRAIP